MSVIHSQKTLHSLKASKGYLSGVYEAFTVMCELQEHTDLTLVTSDGKAFGVHKVVLVGCSSVLKKVLTEAQVACRCEKPTIYLPDFSSTVIKSLLCLIYTGQSESDCSLDELRPLAQTLKINIRNVVSGVGSSTGVITGDPPDPSAFLETPSHENGGQHEEVCGDNDEEEEIMEVTPEVDTFFHGGMGNHFLLSSSNDVVNNGEKSEEDCGPSGGVFEKQGSLTEAGMTGGGVGGGSEDFNGGGVGYLCRLCGRTTPSPASLFSHLLYPHYAHLWRDEIPQRKQKYDCSQCDYTTKNRQRFVMHVARVHDDLRRKLTELGENLEVLANTSYNTRCATPGTSKIISTVAKMGREGSEQDGYNGSGSHNNSFTYDPRPSPHESTPERMGNVSHLSNAASQQPKLVRCRVCGSWKRRENFFTHMVSVHFRHLWDQDIPKTAPLFTCTVPSCSYSTKYRYNMLFHLGGRHKQLRDKIRAEGYDDLILSPIDPEVEPDAAGVNGDDSFRPKDIDFFKRSGPGLVLTGGQQPRKYVRKISAGGFMSPGMGAMGMNRSLNLGVAGGGINKAKSKRLACKLCGKVAHNHASHRLHVVSKHFSHFWADVAPHPQQGIFECAHTGCEYKSANRQVFIIHQAFVHSELKIKLEQNGQDISLGEPLGKRNSIFPTTQLSSPKVPGLVTAEVSLGAEEQVDGQPSIKSEMMQDPSMAELDESNGDTGSAIHSTDEGDDKDHLEPEGDGDGGIEEEEDFEEEDEDEEQYDDVQNIEEDDDGVPDTQ